MDGNNVLGTVSLDASGNAAFTTSTLALGSHTITAIYSGDAIYASNAAFLTQTISQGGTTTFLSVAPSSPQPGQDVTLTATVTPAYGSSGTPTGDVTFLDGTNFLGNAPVRLVNGQYQAILYGVLLSSGSHVLTATYGDDNIFAASSGSQSVVVGQPSGAGSTVFLTSSANSSLPGQSVTFTVTVYGMAGGTPTGNITFYDGDTVLATEPLSVVGGQAQATFTTSSLDLGIHDILAVYSGDGTFAANASSLTQTVVQGGTSLSLTSSANPSPQSQEVTFTATLMAMGGGTPTGTVSFYDGTMLLGMANVTLVNGQYQASFTTAALGLGSHTIVAIYSDDSTFAESGASLDQSITS